MRVLTIINKQVSMCYGCITLAFDARIERLMQEDLEMLIPDDEEEGYNRQLMAEENERQMEAEQGK
jgi:cell division protein FtsL